MKLIREKLIDSVLDETGIKLNPKDVQIITEDSYVKISLWDTELLEVSYEDGDLDNEDFAEDVVKDVFEENFDFREKIIELKLEDLNNNHLPQITEVILEKLENNKIDETLLDVLDFEFIDLGYNNGNFTNPGEEEWNYPPMALRVTDFEDFEHCITIDPYKELSVLNYDLICSEITKKVRGKI